MISDRSFYLICLAKVLSSVVFVVGFFCDADKRLVQRERERGRLTWQGTRGQRSAGLVQDS